MLQILGIIALLGVLAAVLLRPRKKLFYANHRKQSRDNHADKSRAQAPRAPYAAVSVKPCPNSCAMAFETSNVRYLTSAAPSLPLEGCNSPGCQCSFRQHQDRRCNRDEDRRIGIGLQTELYGTAGEKNRRKKRRGRRLGDRH
ncbi:hypothetical protein [Congregibacter sp.]|uniref:hypothetical protein n=1 Tax=Congregibacter sp. TaxID=2744308 RepID=UPI003F6B6A1F